MSVYLSFNKLQNQIQTFPIPHYCGTHRHHPHPKSHFQIESVHPRLTMSLSNSKQPRSWPYFSGVFFLFCPVHLLAQFISIQYRTQASRTGEASHISRHPCYPSARRLTCKAWCSRSMPRGPAIPPRLSEDGMGNTGHHKRVRIQWTFMLRNPVDISNISVSSTSWRVSLGHRWATKFHSVFGCCPLTSSLPSKSTSR